MSYLPKRPGSWYLTMSATWRRKRPSGGRDAYGNDVYTTVSSTLGGLMWEARGLPTGSEFNEYKEQVHDQLAMYCSDATVDIRVTDQFVIDGVVWEVDTPVGRYTGSRLVNDYCSWIVRRVTG